MANLCPELLDMYSENDCLENLPGLGSDVYIGLKSDLAEPMTLTDGVYSTPKFKEGKGLYIMQCKDDKQQIQGSSLGPNGAFELTCNFSYGAVNEFSQKMSRAINNLRIFIIAIDGEKSQIMYDKNRNVRFDQGGITSDTGMAATDTDTRLTNYSAKLAPVIYDHLYVQEPEEGWNSLLASAQPGE